VHVFKKSQSITPKSSINKIIEFYIDISDKLLPSQSSGFSEFKKSHSTQKEYKNMTSIRLHPVDIELVLRNFILSSHIILDENQIWDVVQTFLNELSPKKKSKNRKNLIVERALRGYLGLLNEVLHVRHVFFSQIEKYLDESQYEGKLECLLKSSKDQLHQMCKGINFEIDTRNKIMREMFASEWMAIGNMKKDMEKLVENCRICEKRVKIFDLVLHSDLCEGYFKMKEDFDSIGKEFLILNKEFVSHVENNKQVYLPSEK
jgi:hypothetical protein